MILLLLLAALAAAKTCSNGEFRTNHSSRDVFKCLNNRWSFHGRSLRQKRKSKPRPALISNKCKNNPNLHGMIGGIRCDAGHDMFVLNCINSKVAYICHKSKWSIYIIHS